MLPNPQKLGPDIPTWLRWASTTVRALFICILVVLVVHVSLPQSEKIWSAHETVGDLIRMVFGLGLGVWLLSHLFWSPKDADGYRIWLYLGSVGVPFALICTLAVW